MIGTRARLPLLLAAALLVAAGCGGTDPTEPREVRTVEPVDAPELVTDERDGDAPTHGLPCSAQPDEQLRLCGAATDNYKASFNERPEQPELRTWLAMHTIEVDDARWRPVDGTPLTAERVELERVDGEPGSLALHAVHESGPGASLQVRTGPQDGVWGVLLAIEGVDELRDQPVHMRIVASDPANSLFVQTRVEYRFDETLAAASPDSLEHGGPAGRWYVAGIATATNLELGWE